MINTTANRMAGFIMFILVVITLSPLLFTNTIHGIAIVLICFGILNKNGLVVIIGYIVGIIGAVVA